MHEISKKGTQNTHQGCDFPGALFYNLLAGPALTSKETSEVGLSAFSSQNKWVNYLKGVLYLWWKQARLLSVTPPALSLPSWQSGLAVLNRTWRFVTFPPLSLSCPPGNLNTNALFQENKIFPPLVLLFGFLLLIVTFALFSAFWQWYQCAPLLLRRSPKHLRKEQKAENHHSTWHNAFYHLSQLKSWKKDRRTSVCSRYSVSLSCTGLSGKQ